MIEVLEFIFSGFWTFVGCAILMGIACQAIVGVAFALKGMK